MAKWWSIKLWTQADTSALLRALTTIAAQLQNSVNQQESLNFNLNMIAQQMVILNATLTAASHPPTPQSLKDKNVTEQ